ncbi:MAG: TolC family protein [Planctomycetes bacterium]|nr:TolC family protein [Planctomycetota bacterium]
MPARGPKACRPVVRAALAEVEPAANISSVSDEAPGEVIRPVAEADELPVLIAPDEARVPPAPAGAEDHSSVAPLTEGGESDETPAIFATDLSAALVLAGGQNPRVAFAQGRIQEAFARARAADVLWLPSLRAGANFNRHEGQIQDVAGRIIDVNRGAMYSGLGAQAVGAASPAVPGVSARFHLADAVFEPRIAGQAAAANVHAADATINEVLLATSLAYLDLLEALQLQRVAEDTRSEAGQLAELTRDFAEAGVAPQSDADRTATELASRRNLTSRADEAVAVASARLAQQLSIDPTVQIAPEEPAVAPIDLVPPGSDVRELVATGLANRPELAESWHLVTAAVERLRRERAAPLVPSVALGLSYGGFGGGLGDHIGNYADRLDFDAAAWWEVRNLGFGERAARDEARAGVDRAQAEQVRVMDQVAREVVEAHAQVEARRGQIETARSAIESAENAYRRDLVRIREGEGLPIEVLQALQARDQARREYVRAVIEYNEAQFRLHAALGWPHTP